MRCTVCNAALSDYESTIRHAITGKFLDICQNCFMAMDVDIPTHDRKDLLHESDLPSPDDVMQWEDDWADYQRGGDYEDL